MAEEENDSVTIILGVVAVFCNLHLSALTRVVNAVIQIMEEFLVAVVLFLLTEVSVF